LPAPGWAGALLSDRRNESAALRPMHGEGAGLEALQQALAPTAGLESSAPAPAMLPEESLRILGEHEGKVLDVTVSPDGLWAASAGEDAIRVWNTATGRLAHLLRDDRGLPGNPAKVAFSPDGARLLSIGLEGGVQLWDLNTEEVLIAFRPSLFRAPGYSKPFLKPAFTPKGQGIVFASDSERVTVWDVSSQELLRELHQFTPGEQEENKNEILAADFNRDRTEVVAAGELIRIWNLQTGAMREFPHPGETITAVAWSPDGTQLLTGGYGWLVRLWDARSGQPIQTLHRHENAVSAVAFGPAGDRLASGSHDGSVWISEFPYEAGRSLQAGEIQHVDGVYGLAFHPDGGSLLSVGEDRTVCVWGPKTTTLRGVAGEDSDGIERKRSAIRMLGLYGGPDVMEQLFALLPRLPDALAPDLLLAILVASAHPTDPVALSTGRWESVMELLGRASRVTAALPWTTEAEQAWMRVLEVEGDDLDTPRIRSAVIASQPALWGGSAGDRAAVLEQLSEETNPKDLLAYLIWGFTLSRRSFGDSQAAPVSFDRIVRGRMIYPQMEQVYGLIGRYPQQTFRALESAVARFGVLDPTPQGYYWTAFEDWLRYAADVRRAFEALSLREPLITELGADPWYDSPEAFEGSVARMRAHIVDSAERVFRTTFAGGGTLPFLDSDHFSELERRRFLAALIYQAEQSGETLRAVLEAYFQALHRSPEDWAGAVRAADAVVAARTPAAPAAAFRKGPGDLEVVVHPVRKQVDRSREIQAKWEAYRQSVRKLAGRSELSGPVRQQFSDLWRRHPREVPALDVVADLAEQVLKAGQRGLDEIRDDSARDVVIDRIQAVRSALNDLTSFLRQHARQSKPVLGRVRLLRDPIRKLTFSTPSRFCLDCLTGIYRDFTQYYVTHPLHQIIVVEDLAHPDEGLPWARLTVAQAQEGFIIATNGLVGTPGMRFLPVVVEYLERYAAAVGQPVLLPASGSSFRAFHDQPGRNWRRVRVDVTLPAGPDDRFHMDLDSFEKLPHRIEGLEAWQYTPPQSAPMEIGDLFPPARLNQLLGMVDQMLGAQREADVVEAFLGGVRDVLGYTGAALYLVDPSSRRIRISGIRTLPEQSRYVDWSEPLGEQAEVLRRFYEEGQVITHLANRFDPAHQDFIDDERLRRDAARYPEGDVSEVAYVVLRDQEDRPWGLLMVNRWEIGERLFPDVPAGSPQERQMEEHVVKLLGALGGSALLALRSVGDIGRLNGYMTLEQRGGQLAGKLSGITDLLLKLHKDAAQAAGGNGNGTGEELTGLIVRTGGLARSLERRARRTMGVLRERRARARASPPRPAEPLRIVSNLDALEQLLSGLSLQVLTAAAWSDSGDLARVREEWLGGGGYASETVEGQIVECWLNLADQTIQMKKRLQDENQALPRDTVQLSREAVALGLLRDRVLSRGSQGQADLSRQVDEAISSIEQFVSELRAGSPRADHAAGLEARSLRSWRQEQVEEAAYFSSRI